MCWCPFFSKRGKKPSRISPIEYAFLSFNDRTFYNAMYNKLSYDWKRRHKTRFLVLDASLYRQRNIAEIENSLEQLNIIFSQRAQRNINLITNQEARLATTDSCKILPIAEAIRANELTYVTAIVCD